jgi:hypothetical protein
MNQICIQVHNWINRKIVLFYKHPSPSNNHINIDLVRIELI